MHCSHWWPKLIIARTPVVWERGRMRRGCSRKRVEAARALWGRGSTIRRS
jgi:hypothetical protein